MPNTTKVTLRLTQEARRGWERIALRHGLTLTALAEAIGQAFDERPDVMASVPEWQQVIAEAQRIDQERRSRR